MFGEAEARAKLKDWARVTEVLIKPDGAFQQMAKTNAGEEWVVRGLLLLGEAQANQADYARAEPTLRGLGTVKTAPTSHWQRLY